MIYNEYAAYADSIPSMGGKEIRKELFDRVKDLPESTSIVELGTWLGAGTAQLALALMYYNKSNPIYSYDKFIVSGRQPEKASVNGWNLAPKEDVYNKVRHTLKEFPVNITLRQCDLSKAEYKDEKIGLFVMDAAKKKDPFISSLKVFYPYFIPGETICIFMDYYLWKKNGEEKHKFQYYFINEHKDNFEYLKDIDTTYNTKEGHEEGAVFKYLGGLVL